MTNTAPMHGYLTGFDNYNQDLPIYVEKPFSEDQVTRLRAVIEAGKARTSEDRLVPGGQEQYNGMSRFDPKKIIHMSRLMLEFICPEDIEATMDGYCKPVHKDELKLCHYNYIDYNIKYGDGRYAPALPPHIDADENLVTFNYMLDGNVEDWQVWVEDTPYDLKKGDAIIFSAVNQVHWRPKRKWSEGEFVEIVSFDYCPPTNYRFTGEMNPIDLFAYPEARKAYIDGLNQKPEFQVVWKIYNEMGITDGIPFDKLADFK
jgi:hypothetical protein